MPGMGTSFKTVALVDTDGRRRAGIVHNLLGAVRHVEPYENVNEFIATKPETDLLLAHDDGASFSHVMDALDRADFILPVAGYRDEPMVKDVVKAMRAGALGYLALPIKPEAIRELEAVETSSYQSWLQLHQRIREARQKLEVLTKREREVLMCLTEGMTSKDIADKLMISARTVEIYRTNLLKRLGCTSTYAAVRIASQAQLIA